MIEGVHYRLTTAHMREHFQRRAAYHLQKAADYDAKVKALGELDLGIEHQTNDPAQQQKNMAEAHRDKARIFSFRAEYVATDETFELSEGDLRTLEFLDRYF